MKAAVIQEGMHLAYLDVPEPLPTNDQELLITMKAAAIKNLDRAQASGSHYSTEREKLSAKIIGGDGVGILSSGQRVYGIGTAGMVAEKALIRSNFITPVPDGLDDATAAALPNAVMGSAMALRFRAVMKPGETVLINGATGVTGRVAVQLAKAYGAGTIIATGRNLQALETLKPLGADQLICLSQDDDDLLQQFKMIHEQTTIHVIIDYLWGHSAEILLQALKGAGDFSPVTRFVSVGAMAGDTIQLSSQILRSVDLQLSGSGLGSWTKDQMQLLFEEILPDAFRLAEEGKLLIEVMTEPMKHLTEIYDQPIGDGKRLVITI